MSAYDLELLEGRYGVRFHYHDQIDSTNEQAFRLGREGAAHGSLILAEQQTAGRGRRGASWFCGENRGLAFTMLLRPDYERALWPRLSLVAGLAVARSIEALGLIPEIKWPNDVLIGGRKVCGILVEAEADFVALGVGLNVGGGFPPELQGQATSLAEEGGSARSRTEHLVALVSELDYLQKQVGEEFPDLLAAVRTRCALTDQQIVFQEGQEILQGECRGIGDGGELLVQIGSTLRKCVAAEKIRVIAP